MNIDDAANSLADAIWSEQGGRIEDLVRTALIDKFARHVMRSLDGAADDLLRAATSKILDKVVDDPVIVGMLQTCSRRAAAKRVTKKLESLGIKASQLTEQERTWLSQHGYDITEGPR